MLLLAHCFYLFSIVISIGACLYIRSQRRRIERRFPPVTTAWTPSPTVLHDLYFLANWHMQRADEHGSQAATLIARHEFPRVIERELELQAFHNRQSAFLAHLTS